MMIIIICLFERPAHASLQSRRVVVDGNTGNALYGYDPVAYFTDHAAIRGKRSLGYTWKGVTWLFSSQANRAVFQADPEVYAPQYGGHGALAMARGYVSNSNPLVWAIYRGRLFLFYSFTARAAWVEAIDLHIKRSDINWTELEGTLAR
ncbi:YHS domain-containing (seleno)protein [Cohaesibacter sp. ES.047]|uniref:YHS domain-containing (seleno)protein n=1 Tax=Cohaesibacter sp. ES.047 TaxID=1798205 RepID=UPI000BB8FD74|nr:YHS domain-containing (seleno)protein [Cohaesibacter sp. ES.047]